MDYQYNTIKQALEDLRAGKIILVTDDPERENEGDMICAAEFATQENINFMATHAKGLICTPMSGRIAQKGLRISAVPGTCSRFWQSPAASWSETDIPKPPLI